MTTPLHRRKVDAVILADETWRQIAAEYRDGTSSTELAAKYGVGKSTVTARLRRMGIDLRAPGHYGASHEDAPSLADDGLMWVRKGSILVAKPIPMRVFTAAEKREAVTRYNAGDRRPETVLAARCYWRERKHARLAERTSGTSIPCTKCNADINEPCRSPGGQQSSETHYVRRAPMCACGVPALPRSRHCETCRAEDRREMHRQKAAAKYAATKRDGREAA
jgi:hypothetical protein